MQREHQLLSVSLAEILGHVSTEGPLTLNELLERTEDREGYVVLSREKAEKMKIWDEVEKAYTDRKVVIGRGPVAITNVPPASWTESSRRGSR